MNLADSQLIKDLADGKLPQTQVSIGTDSIVRLAIGLVMVGIILMLSFTIIKKIAK